VVVAGFILGCVEQVFGGYVFRDYKDAYPFLLMIFIVVLKPAGLFGETVSERY
jgi:branched-chain amino acid transport system permease protein